MAHDDLSRPCPECQALRSLVTELMEPRAAPATPAAPPPLRYRVADAMNDALKGRLGFAHVLAKRIIENVGRPHFLRRRAVKS